jgi:predicted MFS family arabinose efflux permease/N-acetylneuraminic acid mutarotase
MTTHCGFALVALLLCAVIGHAEEPPLHWQRLADLPDPVGFAGAYAGVSHDSLLVAGGANFPDLVPWQGGTKVWYDRVFVLESLHGEWKVAGSLPRPLGYGASVTIRQGVVCIGGGDARQHYRDVFRMEWRDGELRFHDLPPLPRPCAFTSAVLLNDIVYVAGGIETPEATQAMKTFWSLDLSRPGTEWQELEPWPGPERQLAVMAADKDGVYLISGTRLDPGPDGTPVREYLQDAYRYVPGQGWRRLADVPAPVVAAPTPAPVVDGRVLCMSGDDGTKVNFRPLDDHPGFPRITLAYDPRSDSWAAAGAVPFSIGTPPATTWRGLTIVCSGEKRPGVRTPEIWAGDPARPAPGFGIVDRLLGLALLVLGGLGALVFWRRSMHRQPSSAGAGEAQQTTLYAWVLLALLWGVAVFNYLDRQVLYSVFVPLRSDMHLSDFQLGLLSTVFLWVYGVLSPFAGFVADRFGRRHVILVSLLVWSVVTWATAHARDFGELLMVRGAMGISEACYIPAALAMIAAVHSPRTRSRATGLHQSGLHIGFILGGVVGGVVGGYYGWRFVFAALGLCGVVYTAILLFVLKDPPVEAAEKGEKVEKIRFLPAIRELCGLPGFMTMMIVFGVTGIVNWAFYTWLPLYLYERFHMSLAEAGFTSGFYFQIAGFFGMFIGGWIADGWSERTPRSRLLTQTAGLVVASIALAGVAGASLPAVLIGCLILFGFGRGFYDCNVMPALCQVARPELRSTGYGIFNMVSCLAGGATAALAGAIKDRVGLDVIFGCCGLILFVFGLSLAFVRLPRQRSAALLDLPRMELAVPLSNTSGERM